MVFIVMSNYLSPKLLFCPADYIHAGAATNISYGDLLSVFTPASGANAPALSAYAKVSYFVGADANEADPQSVLAGDCNIGNSGTTGNSPAAVRFGTTVSATSSAPEVTATAFSTSANNWAWTAADLHQGTGNLLFADGSVQSATISGLHLALQNATNTVNGPCWNFLP
jgi:prepilin-type processing-associated H-X9-DG protein